MLSVRDKVDVGFDGVEEVEHGLGEVFATDSTGDCPHVLQDLDRVLGVFADFGFTPIDYGYGGVGSAFGLAGATHQLLAGVIAAPTGDVGDGVEDAGLLFLPGLVVRGGVLFRDLGSGAHRNVFVAHDLIVVVPTTREMSFPGTFV